MIKLSEAERLAWDERYRTGTYTPRAAAGPFLESWIPRLPAGRTLDVACGAGRNALRLAGAGHQVDAVDVSAVALELARTQAEQRNLEVNWINADIDDYDIDPAGYDLITVIRYVNRGLWLRLIDGLRPDGWVLIEHHLATDADVDGPSNPDFRLKSRELLDAFSSLRVVFYEETIEPAYEPGLRFALARLVACKGDPGF